MACPIRLIKNERQEMHQNTNTEIQISDKTAEREWNKCYSSNRICAYLNALSPQNISGTSPQNSVPAFSETSEKAHLKVNE